MSGDLSRKTVTSGSRLILPCYPILSAYIGFAFMFEDPARTSPASFDAAKSLMPIRWWGAVFVAAAVVVASGYLTRTRKTAAVGLCFGAGLYAAWAWFYVASLFISRDASLIAPAWAGLVAAAHLASAKSLGQDRVI